ncbi:LuxR C-terminal-related transcriptional regulator [Streptomyces sp. T-3]|nr:LuxR C-terminal-related transcriptional regulator [Streptomyces sp. T-3]
MTYTAIEEPARTALEEPETAPLPELTARERTVLRLLAEGLSNRAIAHRLMLSPHTVKEHVSIIFAKLGTDTRVCAAVRAVRSGLI